MKVSIIGAGYVGFTTGVCLAEIGHEVLCIENDSKKLKILQEGKSPIYEPGIEALLQKNIANNRISFEDNIRKAVECSEIIFICVNTPPREDGFADLRYVERVAREIAVVLNEDYKVIVDKSTVPVQTAEKVKDTILKYSKVNAQCDVVSNPEFLREGSAVEDTLSPDRIVIGVDSDRAKNKMLELYAPIISKSNAPVAIVSVRSAELIKHGANTFLSMKISFANLIAAVCDEVKANAEEVLYSIGLDNRIGSRFLNPGIGFGGSCFPKDIAAFKRTLEILGIDHSLVDAVEEINRQTLARFIQRIERELWVLDGKVIGVLGLAFKPNTDDLRNAPALKLMEKFQRSGAHIKAYDPQAMNHAKKIFPGIEYCDNPYSVAEDSEVLIFCTEWEEFKQLDMERVKKAMMIPTIFDGRNIFDRTTMSKLGFKYFSVGR